MPIGERALAWLEKYLIEVRPLIVAKAHEGYVFLTSAGHPVAPNHLSWLVRRCVMAADFGKSGACHIFRHYLPFLTMSSDIGQRLA